MDLSEAMAPVAERLAAVPTIKAAAVVGSQASAVASEESDVDLFIYVDGNEGDLGEERADIVAGLAEPGRPVFLGVPGHANTDAWVLEGTGVWIDAMYWSATWAEEELDWRIVRHSPKVGYSTAFWRSIKSGVPIFERDGWHADLQRRAAAPYPDELRDAIMHLNRQLIGQEDPFSFRHRIAVSGRSRRRGSR